MEVGRRVQNMAGRFAAVRRSRSANHVGIQALFTVPKEPEGAELTLEVRGKGIRALLH